MSNRSTNPIHQVLAKSQDASVARRQVRHLFAAALVGRHDPERLDHAILEERRAEQAARSALAAWARWHHRQAA